VRSAQGVARLENLEEYTGLKSIFLEANALDSLDGLLVRSSAAACGLENAAWWLCSTHVTPMRARSRFACRALACVKRRRGQVNGNIPKRVHASGAQCCTELRCIFAQQNMLTSLAPLAALPHLDTLNVSANRLASLDGLDAFPVLTSLQVSPARAADDDDDDDAVSKALTRCKLRSGWGQLAGHADCTGVSAPLRAAFVAGRDAQRPGRRRRGAAGAAGRDASAACSVPERRQSHRVGSAAVPQARHRGGAGAGVPGRAAGV